MRPEMPEPRLKHCLKILVDCTHLVKEERLVVRYGTLKNGTYFSKTKHIKDQL